MDETLFKVIDEPNETGYFWVTRSTKEFSKHQIIMFHYYNTRAGKTIGQIHVEYELNMTQVLPGDIIDHYIHHNRHT